MGTQRLTFFFQVVPVRCRRRRRLDSLHRVRRSLRAEFHVRILFLLQQKGLVYTKLIAKQHQAPPASHHSHHLPIAKHPLPPALPALLHPQQHQQHPAHHQRCPAACPCPLRGLTRLSPSLLRGATSPLHRPRAASLLRPVDFPPPHLLLLLLLLLPPLVPPRRRRRRRGGRQLLRRGRIRHRRGWVISDDLVSALLTILIQRKKKKKIRNGSGVGG